MTFFERCEAAVKENQELYKEGVLSTGYGEVHLTSEKFKELFGTSEPRRDMVHGLIRLYTKVEGREYFALFNYPENISDVQL